MLRHSGRSKAARPLNYARSKAERAMPRFLRMRWIVPVARSRFPCLGTGVRCPFAGFAHISWEPSALPLKDAAQVLQLAPQLPVGHTATVRLPRWAPGASSSSGIGSPCSLRISIIMRATSRSSRRVSSGVSPQPCSPARPAPRPSTSLLRSRQVRAGCSPTDRCPFRSRIPCVSAILSVAPARMQDGREVSWRGCQAGGFVPESAKLSRG